MAKVSDLDHKFNEKKNEKEKNHNRFERSVNIAKTVFFRKMLFFIKLVENYMLSRSEMMKPMSIDVLNDSESAFSSVFTQPEKHTHVSQNTRKKNAPHTQQQQRRS